MVQLVLQQAAQLVWNQPQPAAPLLTALQVPSAWEQPASLQLAQALAASQQGAAAWPLLAWLLLALLPLAALHLASLLLADLLFADLQTVVWCQLAAQLWASQGPASPLLASPRGDGCRRPRSTRRPDAMWRRSCGPRRGRPHPSWPHCCGASCRRPRSTWLPVVQHGLRHAT